MQQHLLVIDHRLRRFFSMLSDALKISVVESEIDRVFADAERDQVSQKSYCFVESNTWSLTGLVEEYEPETIWIRLSGWKKAEINLTRIVGDCYLEF